MLRKKKLYLLIFLFFLFNSQYFLFIDKYQNQSIFDNLQPKKSAEENKVVRNITIFFPSEQYYNSSITSIDEPIIESLILFNVDYQFNFTFIEKNETYGSIVDSLSKESGTFSDIWKDNTSDPKIPIIHLSDDGTNHTIIQDISANITQSVFKALKEAWFIGAIDDLYGIIAHLASNNNNNGEKKISSFSFIWNISISLIAVIFIIQYNRNEEKARNK